MAAAENPFVEVSWRGLRVGRVKLDTPPDGGPGFLFHETPLPVGTELEVQPEGGALRRVRVIAVIEQEGGKDGQPPPPPGMRVVWLERPAVAAVPEPAVPEPAVPEAAVPEPAVPEPAVPEAMAAEITAPTPVAADGPADAGADAGADADPKPKRPRRRTPAGDPRPPRLGGKDGKKKA